MKRNYRSLLAGLVVIVGLGAMTASLHADPSCYKREGVGLASNSGTRVGCGGEGDVCFWNVCADDNTQSYGINDDCFSWVTCRPAAM